jgi:hypothetical protein
VIQKSLVFHKTAKGAEAIGSRQHGLSPKLRPMLILIDGKRSFEELERLSQMLGDTQQVVTQLLEQGMIEPIAAPPPQQATDAPVASAPVPLAAAPTTALSLPEAQKYISRRLTKILGPNADELCLRIEGARNLHDFQVAVGKAEGMLRQFVSARIAAEFAADAQAHMPSA